MWLVGVPVRFTGGATEEEKYGDRLKAGQTMPDCRKALHGCQSPGMGSQMLAPPVRLDARARMAPVGQARQMPFQ
ncbi:hypothetical protein GLI01_26380 [Gluconacetobacter liquefaciens]|uniref:Uncharacterized protein n=1 Tax=Gluconacetobacter liquefaciens TaxID=89584 RepID=A0A7W4JMJ4_GLULI|nr:hypothetical protein [Gluconacetobacter liquefaciens]MBB2187540.1 hypothetical protein [Gluconacetobacter liquefaciens]GEB38603.1 hypothetical protein GLI01_26380 [Gluconacetobacter liquefaciens]